MLVTTSFEKSGNLLQIGDGIQIKWCLLATEAAVEIRADAGVQRVAGKLADAVLEGRQGVQADMPEGEEEERAAE